MSPEPHETSSPLISELDLALVAKLDDATLYELAAEIRSELRRRAIDAGDQDELIADAFEIGFTRDGLGVQPWITGPFIVCPGGLVARSRNSHRCRFVSVDDTWIWESPELLREEKRSTPGSHAGFRAIALLPIVEGMALDVVSGRLRSGQHGLERVISLEVRNGVLVEVAQREVNSNGMA